MRKSIYTEKQKRFCALITEKRNQAGLTQAAVAKKMGRPQSFVAKYENSERRLDVVEFMEVAEAIGFDPERFVRELKC